MQPPSREPRLWLRSNFSHQGPTSSASSRMRASARWTAKRSGVFTRPGVSVGEAPAAVFRCDVKKEWFVQMYADPGSFAVAFEPANSERSFPDAGLRREHTRPAAQPSRRPGGRHGYESRTTIGRRFVGRNLSIPGRPHDHRPVEEEGHGSTMSRASCRHRSSERSRPASSRSIPYRSSPAEPCPRSHALWCRWPFRSSSMTGCRGLK